MFEDVIVNPLPLFHMYGFSEAGLIAVIAGCKHVLMDRFDADECMRLVEAEGGTITHGFDTHYKEYLDSLERTPRDISSLRFGTFPSWHDQLGPHCAAGADRDVAHLHRLGHDRDLYLRYHVVRQLDAGAALGLPRAIRRRASRSRSWVPGPARRSRSARRASS